MNYEGFQALNITQKDNYAIVQIDNGKVNAINLTLVQDLKEAFDQLDQDDSIKGAILAGRPHAFSAGLDIVSIAMMNSEARHGFWMAYMGALKSMVHFSKPLVCAITGYAPAGATILTLVTDYRVMGKGPKHVMGMHEFKMQMLIPQMLADVYAYHLGEVNGWKAVQQARLFNSDEALAIGLVDESVEVEEVLPRAEKHLQKQIQVYGKVYNETKQYMRRGLYKIVNQDHEALAARQVEFNQDPYLQSMVRAFVTSLKKG